jgi:NADH-quinone oxidoreductase subunit L
LGCGWALSPPRPEHPEEEEPAAHAQAGDSHAHQAPHAAIHDAPPAMAFALIVLAIGSVVAGYVGIGGRFEQFLAPSFGPETVAVVTEGVSENVLMGASIVTAILGILIAAWYFLQHRSAADRLAAKFAGLHTLLTNKYYVDEIYDATVVQPIHIVSEEGLWKAIDVNVIDGAVNGVAETVGGSSHILRRLQTGSVRAYAASLFAGVVLILGFYLWR